MADFKKELDEVYAKYKSTVNMSASQLEAWSKNPCSKLASLDRSPITRNLRLLRKKKSEWTAKDVADANRTISFVSRMKGAGKGEPTRVPSEDYPNGCPSKRDISLRNWAYNPGGVNKSANNVNCGCKPCLKSTKNVNLKSNQLVKEDIKMDLKETLEKVAGVIQSAVRKDDSTIEVDAAGLIEFVEDQVAKADAEEPEVRQARLEHVNAELAKARDLLADADTDKVTIQLFKADEAVESEEDTLEKRLNELTAKVEAIVAKAEEVVAHESHTTQEMDHRQSDDGKGADSGGGPEVDLNDDDPKEPAEKSDDSDEEESSDEDASDEEVADDTSGEEATEEEATEEEATEEEATEEEADELEKSDASYPWPKDLNDLDAKPYWGHDGDTPEE